MRLDTQLDWAIKCPNCLTMNVYKTDKVFTDDNRLELTFSCHCPRCEHHFGYIQTYTNDSDTDRYADMDDMKDYQL